jgi:hypothetical protein
MAVLRFAVAAAALAGCYSPTLRDCAVACESPDDCAPSQVCGSDRWCASPELAGRCLAMAMPDAAPRTDAAPVADAAIDAPPQPDAPTTTQLVVQIAGGHGVVTIAGVGTCSDTAPGHMCSFTVLAGGPLSLTAMGTGEDEFDKWTSIACAAQGATCTLTPTPPTITVAAKFRH